ncbi:MAG: hypothetical protein AVDCRST_MAG87-3438 [uncultured Thermomicrobiales bacterium]|uniref:Uncharacterized protein n=1 Tax=uncultured Thermomicrobiales bacterium TaxID=1645740 RepID=A0A6J4VL90_9BACT|nr:MAG: hypothetical protein AVDCRST_MAG87-3438 [uncultured Thermomicrobiales bacterium]
MPRTFLPEPQGNLGAPKAGPTVRSGFGILIVESSHALGSRYHRGTS